MGVTAAAGAWFGGTAMDKMICNGFTVLVTRRRVMVVSLLLAGISLIPLGFTDSISVAGMSFCCVTGALGALDVVVMANYVDVAPDCTAPLVGLGNTIATIPGAIGPRVVAAILDATGSWTFVFGLVSMLMLISAPVFAMLGAADEVY